MLPVEQPYKIYTDLDGKPLDNGYVYFGLPNQNPQTAPVEVFWDAAGTIPAAQPLRTVNGYIMRGGTPANVFCDVAYSELVLDSKKRQVLLARTSDDFSVAAFARSLTASQVAYAPAGDGATPMTVQDVLRQEMTNLDFVPLAERAAILAGTSTYDATAAVQKAIDAAGSTRRLRWLGVVNTRTLSSAASVDWVFEGGAKVKQVPAVYATSAHITLSGPRIRIENAEFDGNQDNMVIGQGGNGLLVSGISPTLLGVKAHDYNGVGYQNTSSNAGVKRGLHIGCSFDDNAGLGMNMIAAAYHDFIGCTFDRNGYGFQRTRANYADTSHGFVAFGIAVRMRSHHITLSSCHARDNGRDGFNVNQGSYSIKFAQCLAYGNDDGGFTIASDDTGSGLPGEGEACFDIEYDGCEAYNNYTSGLVAYQACSNVRVLGGRYYNNHRVAGNQAAAAAYYNGIYFAGGSNGIDVDAAVYDERQVRSITGVSGGTLAAAGWVPGTMTYYPKVAIYAGADQSFKGYGRITAEGTASVTIVPTTYDGVVLSTIAAGDYVSQAIQHNGVFTDNNCQGAVVAAGGGHALGANGSLTGKLIISGGFASGQNILLPRERASVELLLNPSFDTDLSNWVFNNPGGGSAVQATDGIKRSVACLRLIGGTSVANGDAVLSTSALPAVSGGFVEFTGAVYASSRGDAWITFFWSMPGAPGAYSSTVTHQGGGWRTLKVGAYVPDGASAIICRVNTAAGKTAYFDTMSLRAVEMRADSRDFTFPSRTLPY